MTNGVDLQDVVPLRTKPVPAGADVVVFRKDGVGTPTGASSSETTACEHSDPGGIDADAL